MSDRDLTSDPAAENLAPREPGEADLAVADALGGGDAAAAPRSLTATELVPDDEDVAAGADWDDPERL
jgi:hypothetical protein